MAKSKTPSFIVEMRLVTHQNELAILDKRFAIAEKLYNKTLYHARTQLTELYKNRRYQTVLAERRLAVKEKDKRRVKVCNEELQAIQKAFGVTEYKLHGVKLTWVRSNHYLKTLFRLKDLYRRRAVALKTAHNKTANAILALGNQVYVEEMDFRALMKRAKETTRNKNGRFNRKKRFGKSIGYHAPAMLLGIVKQKAPQEGGSLQKVKTVTFRASQYNHSDDTYIKKTLDERTAFVGGHRVQRDLYSAFLLKNSQPNLKETDRTKCRATFATFLTHHDTCIQTLCQSLDHQSSNFGLKDFQFA